jgi:hypothetical protein
LGLKLRIFAQSTKQKCQNRKIDKKDAEVCGVIGLASPGKTMGFRDVKGVEIARQASDE